MNHAEDGIAFADLAFAALIANIAPIVPHLRTVVFLTHGDGIPDVALPAGVAVHAKPATAALDDAASVRLRLRQGRDLRCGHQDRRRRPPAN
jgi:hypothetical protein